MSGMNETLIQGMKESILMPPDMQLPLSEGKIMSIKEVLLWILLDELFVDRYFQSYPDYNRKAELVRWLRSKVPERPTKNCRDIWYVGGRTLEEMVNVEHICSSSEDPPVEQSFQAGANGNGHKFNMTEDEYNLWKDMPEKLKDVLIQIIPEKAEVVGRLRSEAREGKAKAASPATQELKTRGGSSTVNYTPESSDVESGMPSIQVDHNEPAEHTSLETQGGSSNAQNEPPPNHPGLPVGGDHHAPESSDMASAMFSTLADNEPTPDRCGHETMFLVVGEGASTVLAIKSAKKSAGEMTYEAEIFWYILIVCIFLGIISLSYGLCLSGGSGRGRRSTVTRVVNTVSYVAIGLAIVTAAGLQLPNQVMVWVIPLVWVIIAPAIFRYAMKQ